VGWLVLLCGAPGLGRAELRRVEAVGIYGIRDDLRSRVIPRDEAIQNALWEGVSRVALEVIGESAGGAELDDPGDATSAEGEGAEPTRDQIEALRRALGKDMLPYTRGFRILEDQGEQPVLFEERPGVRTEYVVVVDVVVDASRVTDALERAGLVASATTNAGVVVEVEVIGLSRYEALERVLSALSEDLGATRVETREFAPERQVLAVEGAFGPAELAARMARYESPSLVLEPIGVDEETRRIRVLGRFYPDPGDPAVARSGL
jgi:hypothetical protein